MKKKRNAKEPMTRRGFLIRMGILGALVLAGGKGFLNSRDLKLLKVDVGLKNLSPAFEGLKIGQITDIHAGPLVPRGLIEKGVDLLMEKQPDMVVLTGDFVSGATRILWTTYGGFKQHHFDACMGALAKLKAPLGVYAVLGNHDFWSGKQVAADIIKGLKGIGVKVLRNENVSLSRAGRTLSVVGVDDYWEQSYSLTRSLNKIQKDGCRVLLSHNPDVNEDIELSGKRIDLVISGHTHGGQIVIPFVGAPYIPSPFGQKYRAGLVKDGDRKTWVSRGLGLFFVPIRLNCPPDVSLLTLRRE
ncbi:metallophosphoesterase [Thermodesulfobacteriota bacterium]